MLCGDDTTYRLANDAKTLAEIRAQAASLHGGEIVVRVRLHEGGGTDAAQDDRLAALKSRADELDIPVRGL